MNIGILDADLISRKKHRFPNLALMKISAFKKEEGHNVNLITDYKNIDNYDFVYMSKVFTDTEIPNGIIEKPHLKYGGTGFFFDRAQPLPSHIEHHKPDYDLYKEWALREIEKGNKKSQFDYYLNTSIGFTTRGCFRHCKFCVNQNYDKVSLHSPIDEFIDKNNHYISLLDDNVVGHPEFEKIWQSLESFGKPFEFKQGMDFRLFNERKIKLIANSDNYRKRSYIFAFDNIEEKDIIVKNLETYRNITDQFTRFYVLCGFDEEGKYDYDFWVQDLWNTFERIKILTEYGCLTYLMRFDKWKESPYRGTYSNLNRWCNYPRYFKKMSYREMNWACAK